jgi:hypothetical protein
VDVFVADRAPLTASLDRSRLQGWRRLSFELLAGIHGINGESVAIDLADRVHRQPDLPTTI